MQKGDSTVGGAPLKPWEVARGPSNAAAASGSPTGQTEGRREDTRGTVTQPPPPTPTYAPYSSLQSPYTAPYSAPRPYGSNYYGYPSGYGSGVYGSNYGNNYGGMYSYGRPVNPWQPPNPYSGPGMPGPPAELPPKLPMWQRFLDGFQKVVHCFGRVTFLVDENTQAFHFFITALLTFLDKAGSLYGEIARFIMRLLGFGRRSRSLAPPKSSDSKAHDTAAFKNIWKSQ